MVYLVEYGIWSVLPSAGESLPLQIPDVVRRLYCQIYLSARLPQCTGHASFLTSILHKVV